MNDSAEHFKKFKIQKVQEYVMDFTSCIQNWKSDENSFQSLITCVKRLRNICCKGYEVQCEIIKIIPVLFSTIENKHSLFQTSEQKDQLDTFIWQLVANLTVNNITTQQLIWENYNNKIKEFLNELSSCTDIQLLVIHNIIKGKSVFLDQKEIFSIVLRVWSNILEMKYDKNMEFLHIFFEEYLCNISCRIVPIYATLEPDQRIATLKYISTYIRSGSPNGQIQKILMEFISKEFKKKSDCILRVNDERLNKIYPYEVLTLIEVISIASGDALYSHIYENDHSLFLNAGGLLHTINEVGKKSNNIFTPMEKLIEVAPNSKINTSFESEISFQLRTYIVRTLANLLYKNKKNQEYVRELNIIAAILDSTRADARNPLIKEWSILAIRNLCENCPENQEIIRNMTKVGEARNEVLTELNLEMGSLRISPKD